MIFSLTNTFTANLYIIANPANTSAWFLVAFNTCCNLGLSGPDLYNKLITNACEKTNLTPVHYPISRRSKYLQEWTIKRVIQNTHILFLLLYVTFYFYVILFCNFFQSRSVVYAVYLIIFSCNMLSTPLIQTILYVPFILWSELIQCYIQDRSSTKVRPLISTKFTLF